MSLVKRGIRVREQSVWCMTKSSAIQNMPSWQCRTIKGMTSVRSQFRGFLGVAKFESGKEVERKKNR